MYDKVNIKMFQACDQNLQYSHFKIISKLMEKFH